MAELPTGTVTFLFTDIEDGGAAGVGPGPGTRLWEQHPDAMRHALARHDALLRAAIETHGGYVFKTGGDAFCAVFAVAVAAVDAALGIQQSLRSPQPSTIGASAELSLRVRIALHTGPAEVRDCDYFGPALNRVARLLTAGHGVQDVTQGLGGVRSYSPSSPSLCPRR